MGKCRRHRHCCPGFLGPSLGQAYLPLWGLACKRIRPLRTGLRLQADASPVRNYTSWVRHRKIGLSPIHVFLSQKAVPECQPAAPSQADTNCRTSVKASPLFVAHRAIVGSCSYGMGRAASHSLKSAMNLFCGAWRTEQEDADDSLVAAFCLAGRDDAFRAVINYSSLTINCSLQARRIPVLPQRFRLFPRFFQ